jgi:hypothetical protein
LTKTVEEPSQRRTLLRLTYLALILSVGHHIDHVIRGNVVGWPVTSEVNAFTASLAIYPIILTGLYLYHRGRVGPGFWAFVSGGGALFLGAIHFGPMAVEPPSAITSQYASPVAGAFALAWLAALVAVLGLTFAYELRLWARSREQTGPG